MTRHVATWLTGYALVLAISIIAAWALGGSAQEAPPSDASMVDRGRTLYVEHHCGVCHALATVGAEGFFGPPHDAMGDVAAARVASRDYEGDATDAAGYIRESIVDPQAYVVPGFALTRHPMPAYDLPEEDLDALVAFLMAQRGGS